MTKIFYKDDFPSRKALNNAVDQAKKEQEEHASFKPVGPQPGPPAPRINPDIQRIIDGEQFEYKNVTHAEEEQNRQKVEADKAGREQEARRQEAENNPSSNFAEFRRSEYLPIGDQLDTILKGFKIMAESGVDIGLVKELVEHHQAVKKKYRKPGSSDKG